MSIPNQALTNLLHEIEVQATQSQQQIEVVRSQIRLKQREIRMIGLTLKEFSSLPADTNVYEGVGKMFVYSPTSKVSEKLQSQIVGLKLEVENLGKKLQYLETTYKNSRDHIDQILKSGSRA
ncbi:hypothetical protein Golomagni_03149 [Golovinomyces magnicellulatus]|nr:hypothetical protein Golomagni_03149 [Golovinomyces magnicellulatus]